MKTFTISFYECEHQGDLDNYKSDMVECGAEIINDVIDYEEETCTIQFKVEDIEEFYKSLKETETYEFIN